MQVVAKDSLSALKNGSDIRGIASSTSDLKVNLTPEAMKGIAQGLLFFIRQTKESQYQAGDLVVGIGCDSRLSGPQLKAILIDEWVDQGVSVIDFGLATTPAMFMSTQFPQFRCDLAVMLTASHLPYYYNGVKVFTQVGGVESHDIQTILAHPEKLPGNHRIGASVSADLLGPYAQDLVNKIRQGTQLTEPYPLQGWKIVVDAGNGAGGFFAENVLRELGADISGSQFLTPDGHFPNHIPNPDNQEAMASLLRAVEAHQADLGVIFDTDVDRSAVVTKAGKLLNRNNLIAVLSQMILQEHPKTSIVTNSPTSEHLQTFIEALGGHQVRYISGYRNVINKAIALNQAGTDCQLAIETSGHAAFKENYFLDDGAYVIAKILMLLPSLQKAGRTLDELISTLKQPVETIEIRFKLEEINYRQLGERVIAALAGIQEVGWQVDENNHEGIRFKVRGNYGSGWFLLRLSLHEPLLVLQVENDVLGKNRLVLARIQKFLVNYPNVNQEKLALALNH
ncbi:MAG: phosphomannomutase/phosphoglucomutase [Enterococcus sp.]